MIAAVLVVLCFVDTFLTGYLLVKVKACRVVWKDMAKRLSMFEDLLMTGSDDSGELEGV